VTRSYNRGRDNIKKNILLILHAVGTNLFFDLVGKIQLAEIIALINLPLINLRYLFQKFHTLKVTIFCLLILLLSQVISDLVNDSDALDYMRGWSVIVFSIISTIFLTNCFYNNKNGLVYYSFMLIISRIIFSDEALDLNIYEQDTNYFKTHIAGISNQVIILVGYYLFKIRKIKIASIIFVIYSIACFIYDARSTGLCFFISSILLYAKTILIRLSGISIFSIFIVILVLFYSAYIFYVNQVINYGIGGTNAKTQLAMTTNPYNPFELLYYGRTNFFILIEAIKDKPIFGHGSWGKDPSGKYTTSAFLGTYYFSPVNISYFTAHSVFLGTWAYAGVLGFLATSYMFTYLFNLFIKVYIYKKQSDTFPIFIFICISMVWSLFFSPIGQLRNEFPLFAALVITEFGKLQYNK
jgi:hypothetical protein